MFAAARLTIAPSVISGCLRPRASRGPAAPCRAASIAVWISPQRRAHKPQRGALVVRMVKTKSMETGLSKAPAFELLEPLTGKTVRLSDFDGSKALLFMVLSNHCPFVKLLKESITATAREYMGKGVAVVGICASSTDTHPMDGPDGMAADARDFEYPFPYLWDETQDVAKAYRAAATPEFYIFDGDRTLVYHGQWDNARPGNGVEVTGADVRAALDAVLEGRPVPPAKPSIGCNIKWKAGAEPEYFGMTSV